MHTARLGTDFTWTYMDVAAWPGVIGQAVL